MKIKNEALNYLEAITNAFGPEEGVQFEQVTWGQMHAAITALLAEHIEPRKVLASIKQEAETGLVIGDEIGMRDALAQILREADEHLGISVMKEPS